MTTTRYAIRVIAWALLIASSIYAGEFAWHTTQETEVCDE